MEAALAAATEDDVAPQPCTPIKIRAPETGAVLDVDDEDGDHSDGDGEPQTVEAFMRRMKRESRLLGDVFQSPEEAERSRLASPPAPAPPRPRNAPPAAWERSLIADFVDLRTRLAVLKARGVGAKANARLPVPRLRDARAWHAFCFGDAEAYPGSDDDEEEDEEAAPAPSPAPAVAATPNGTLPTVRLVLQFDLPMTQRLLAMHCGWLEAAPPTKNRALWAYALLARLDKPLHRDTCAVLRALVKRLLAGPRDPAADVLLVVAGRYFDQASVDEIGPGPE